MVTSGVISCGLATTLGEVSDIMLEKQIHAVVVVENDQPVGVVSQTDLVLAYQTRTLEQLRQTPASEVMSRGCITCGLDTLLSDAITIMTRNGIHRIVVVSEKEGKSEVYGVLSMTDIIGKFIRK
ncbi:CBS domain-containing protein [Deltaproteobacteria bacterium TL4]